MLHVVMGYGSGAQNNVDNNRVVKIDTVDEFPAMLQEAMQQWYATG